MALIIKDRIKEVTSSIGTGNISLGGTSATFNTFSSVMTTNDTTYYAIVHTSSGVDEWEVGLGTYNSSGELERTTVLNGSSGTSAVNFSSGTKDVFMTYPADKAAFAGGDVSFADITVSGTVDGRDVATDGTKLDTIETNADVTDATNVAAAGALMTSGGTMTGNLILNADPTTALGAATKEYVDTIAAAGIHYHTPVRVESPSNLNATYDNGTSGVGATLTNAGTNAAITIDGVALSLNDRVLVYNQTNAAHNGIYTVTTVGDGSTAWVLTRATDADSYGPSDPDALGEGDAYFVKEGDTGAGELYVMNTSGVITFGTTAITFTVIAETAVYSAGDSLTLTGTTFDTVQDIRTTASPTFASVTANLTGDVTGNVSGSSGSTTGNAATATKLATARTIQLSGDVTGSITFDGTADVNITAAVTDDSHAHIISNVDGLQTALDGKVDTTRTITAGNGFAAGSGGDLSANRSFTIGGGTGVTVYANDVAIGQDVATTANVTFNSITVTGTVDGVDIASRDAVLTSTTTTANAALPKAGGTMTGNIVMSGAQTVDGRDLSVDGAKLDGIEAGATADQTKADIDALGINAATADKWTTARTLSLSGDASGSVSWDGSANATLSVAVNNNSHNHTYFSVYGASDLNSLSNSAYDKFIPFASTFQASNRPAANYAGGFEVGIASSSDNYRGQLAFVAGSANQGPYVRTKTSGTWNSWNQVWHAGNDGSGSGLDADTLDGSHASAFAPAGGSYGTDWYANQCFADNWFRPTGDTGLYFQSYGTGIRSVQSEGGTYGSVATYSGINGWEGYSIGGRVVFMHDTGSGWGIYNDVNEEWMIYGTLNAETRMYYNGTNKFQTTSAGAQVNGNLTVTGSISGSISGATQVPTSGITQHPVGSYLTLSRNVSGANLPKTFYTTQNAASGSFNAYDIVGGSYHLVTINYGTWMCMGLTYGYYDVTVVRIA